MAATVELAGHDRNRAGVAADVRIGGRAVRVLAVGERGLLPEHHRLRSGVDHLGRADRLKRIKEQLRRRRFPRLAETEDQIRKHINALKLQPEIRLSVTPGLEGGQLNVEFQAGTTAEFKAAVRKLGEATSLRSFPAIFELLSGQHGKGQC